MEAQSRFYRTRTPGRFDQAKQRGTNAWNIGMGLFEADKDKSEFNQMLQVFSRFTWQLPTTLTGYGLASFYNDTRRLDDVQYFHGATVLVTEGIGSAISIGGFIVINPKYGDIDYGNATLLHEYGHFLQSRKWGGLAYNPGYVFQFC